MLERDDEIQKDEKISKKEQENKKNGRQNDELHKEIQYIKRFIIIVYYITLCNMQFSKTKE